MKEFIEKVFSINPSFSNIFGGSLPGLSGKSIISSGAGATASDIVRGLRRSTRQFAEMVSSHAPSEEVVAAMKKIEGDLLNLTVLGQIDDETSKSLVEELYTLGDS